MTGTLDFLRGAISGSTITREGGPRDCLRELLEVEKRCLEAIYTVKAVGRVVADLWLLSTICQKFLIRSDLVQSFRAKNDKI